jgi:hypothetical protein
MRGVPAAKAVLVNSSDFDNATWQPYGSNVVASLNAGDGDYDVWVGLRGRPADAEQTWQHVLLTLDAATAIVVTNPAAGIVSQPFIQLQGYSTKPLDHISFDVTNALGVITNQRGYITGQFYDVNLMRFTTNWFRCYDIALADGPNRITLRATDVAGETMLTNLDYMLDYSGDTSPPIFAVIWPPDGTAISGNQVTLHGKVDDLTAKITAQIVDAAGNTNTAQALIGENGQVWAQNLPLNSGTNVLTVTATDMAGNQVTTNLILTQSSMIVTMNPLSGSQLNQQFVTVNGTVTDPSCVLTVNGVQAAINGDGTWEVVGVPVSPTRMAVFSFEVYSGSTFNLARNNFRVTPLDDNPEGGNIGSGLVALPNPVTVVVSGYSGVGVYTNLDEGWFEHETLNWTYNAGGYYTLESPSGYTMTPAFCPPADENLVPPEWWIGWGYTNFIPVWEQSAVTFADAHRITQRTNHMTVMLVPSGCPTEGTMNFYLVRAHASEFASLPVVNRWQDVLFYLRIITEYQDSPGIAGDVPLPPEWLQINGQTLVNSGITNTDGAFWGVTFVQAPASAIPDVTPTATNFYVYNDYTFDVQAYQLGQLLAVDYNRDGQIALDDSDATTPDKPFRFWINDSKESGDIADVKDQIPEQSYLFANYSLIHVNGRSDLVNFFPVALCLSNIFQWLPPTNGFEYRLVQNDSAVKFVYTSLTPTNIFDYLTNTASYGYGTNFDEAVTNADTIQVPNIPPGIALDTNWLAWVRTNGGTGIILMEGCAATVKPLWLVIWKDGQLLGGVPLYLSITGVEQMFRHLNFSYVNGTVNVPSRADATNEPPTNDKNFVFLHGYNVNQQQARGVLSEVFKRMYWSGSKAKFYGVTWNGAESQWSSVGFTPNYHTNVVNALQTASHLADFLGTLPSNKTAVAAHSLGNMVVLSAISDFNAQPSKYFMIDAAVSIEAVQGNAARESAMVYSTWQDYSNRLYATDWWQLFTNDYRSTLTWSNRLGNFGSVDIYNFYSSGEEVLREDTDDPPSGILSGGMTELLNYYGARLPLGTYAWVWQEKGKGTALHDDFIGSTHGGWRFSYYWRDSFGNPLSPSIMNDTPYDILQNQPMFSVGSSLNGPPDQDLLGVDASAYAQTNRNRILSDAIPALTLPIGANHVDRFAPYGEPDRNFNMQTEFETGWPATRSTGDEAFNWHHSDFGYVAYPFVHKLFDEIVNDGNLK